MWEAVSKVSCLGVLLGLALALGASLAGALTDWPVDGVKAVGSLLLFAGLILWVTTWFFLDHPTPQEEREQHAKAPRKGDLARLETALGVSIPDEYRRLMLEFPVRFDRGNADADLWNDVDALLARNRKLRSAPHPWPEHYLFVGDDGAGGDFALDLSDDEGRVAVFQFCDPGRGEPPTEFTTLGALVERMREDARGNGLDPDAARRPPPEPVGARVRGCLVFWAVIVVLSVAMGSCIAWMKSP